MRFWSNLHPTCGYANKKDEVHYTLSSATLVRLRFNSASYLFTVENYSADIRFSILTQTLTATNTNEYETKIERPKRLKFAQAPFKAYAILVLK